LGYCYYQLKDYKDAVEDFENSLANDRGNDLLKHERQRLFLYLGIIYEKNKDNDKAVEAYKNSADWGYEGALAKLENLGVPYIPEEPSVKPYVQDTSQQKQQTQNTQQRAQQTKGLASNSSKKEASSNIKNKKFGLVLPTVVGFIIGVVLILIVSNLPKNEERAYAVKKPPKITATVITDITHLRSEPYYNSYILKILNNGNIVEITGDVSGEWTPVEYEGTRGWVSSELIELK